MRTRKAAKATPTLVRLGRNILGYIDLLVRTVCIILGLVVSGWVKFIDEIVPPAAPTQVSTTVPQWSPYAAVDAIAGHGRKISADDVHKPIAVYR